MWADPQTQRIDYDDDDDLLIPSVSVMEFMVFASEFQVAFGEPHFVEKFIFHVLFF